MKQAVHVAEYGFFFLVLIGLIQVYNLFYTLQYTNWILHTQASRIYACFYTFLLTGVVAAGIFLYRQRKRLPQSAQAIMRMQFVSALVLAVWAAAVNGYDQRISGNITLYSTMVITLSVLVYLKPLQAIVVFGLAQGLFVGMLLFFQGADADSYGVGFNSTIMAIMAFLMSFFRYANERIHFRDQQIIIQQNRQLSYRAEHDELTGIWNRHFLDWQLPAVCRRNVARQTPIAFFMVDIDSFKLYNDAYGHQRGDACLAQVAQALKRLLQTDGEYIIRYGGEEFLIVAEAMQRKQAQTRAEELCAAVRALQIEDSAAANGYVTVSMGVSCDVLTDESGYAHCIREADRALYEACLLYTSENEF